MLSAVFGSVAQATGSVAARSLLELAAVWLPRIALGTGAVVIGSSIVQNTADAIAERVEGGDNGRLLRRLLLDNALMPGTITVGMVVNAVEAVGLSTSRISRIARGELVPTQSDLDAMQQAMARVLAQAMVAGQGQPAAGNGVQA